MKKLNAKRITMQALLLLFVTGFLGCAGQTTAPDTDDEPGLPASSYAIVDTGQEFCYDNQGATSAPAAGEAFHGQDAQYDGAQPSYSLSDDGLIVYDEITGLTWVRSPDANGDGELASPADKLTWTEAQAYPATLNAAEFGGYSDWRLPSIKELYSLTLFSGEDMDPSASSGGVPFIDTSAFTFVYGNAAAGERAIDSQYASSTLYVGDSAEGRLLFGVNFADGRIKVYGLSLMGSDKTFFIQCVRGNTSYGINAFADDGDGAVTDAATAPALSAATQRSAILRTIRRDMDPRGTPFESTTSSGWSGEDPDMIDTIRARAASSLRDRRRSSAKATVVRGNAHSKQPESR